MSEKQVPIMKRMPPGDRWTLIDSDEREIHPTLTMAIEAIFRHNGSKRFIVDAEKGIISVVQEVEDTPDPPKQFSIYGEHY